MNAKNENMPLAPAVQTRYSLIIATIGLKQNTVNIAKLADDSTQVS